MAMSLTQRPETPMGFVLRANAGKCNFRDDFSSPDSTGRLPDLTVWPGKQVYADIDLAKMWPEKFGRIGEFEPSAAVSQENESLKQKIAQLERLIHSMEGGGSALAPGGQAMAEAMSGQAQAGPATTTPQQPGTGDFSTQPPKPSGDPVRNVVANLDKMPLGALQKFAADEEIQLGAAKSASEVKAVIKAHYSKM